MDNLAEYLKYKSRSVSHDPKYHVLGNGLLTCDFFILLDLINFGSGYQSLDRGECNSTYFTIAGGLKKWFSDLRGRPSLDRVSSVSDLEFLHILNQSSSEKNLELCRLMERSFKSFARHAEQIGATYCSDIIGVGERDVDDILDTLIQIDSFKDVSTFRGKEVYFLKRAQILCQDLSMCSDIMEICQIRGLEKLTCFADNLVPAVLYHDGVLEYSAALIKAIENNDITAGSELEIELRAASICAVDAIVEIAAGSDATLTANVIDVAIWSRGQDLKKSAHLLRHFTETDKY